MGACNRAKRCGLDITIALAGLIYLALAVNFLSALVTAFITLSYLVLYTPMKPRSSLCMLVGAVPGALPPVIGWVAARGSDNAAWVLFAIMFLWQVPHTLAIARLYCEDYAKAGIQFLPVIEPDGESTNRQIVSHSAALLAVSLLPTLLGSAGLLLPRGVRPRRGFLATASVSCFNQRASGRANCFLRR